MGSETDDLITKTTLVMWYSNVYYTSTFICRVQLCIITSWNVQLVIMSAIQNATNAQLCKLQRIKLNAMIMDDVVVLWLCNFCLDHFHTKLCLISFTLSYVCQHSSFLCLHLRNNCY